MQDTFAFLSRDQISATTNVLPHNLPMYLTSLIGKEEDIETVCTLLRRLDVRLLTLTGSGGVGKTRLAIQVAKHLLDDYKGRCYFISLAATSTPEQVFSTIAQTFGIEERTEEATLTSLGAFLRAERYLLLLDNLEQVVSVAPQLVRLLESCPDLKMLVTSRVVLNIQGEYAFPVAPLALPDVQSPFVKEKLSANPAVTLFLHRAQAVNPVFRLTADNASDIVQICRRLDGLPLALELAAAQSTIFSPQALVRRLDQSMTIFTTKMQNVPWRHQTLGNTLSWSYNLLNEQEQKFLRQLAIFTGGCSLEAVEALCENREGGIQALDGIITLMNHSLLQQTNQDNGEPRFYLLEMLRLYGLERLVEHNELEVMQRAHALYYLKLAQRVDSELTDAGENEKLRSLEQEQANLRAALDWLGEHPEREQKALHYILEKLALRSLPDRQAPEQSYSVSVKPSRQPGAVKECVDQSQSDVNWRQSLLKPRASSASLTRRETEVLRLLAGGLTDALIAEQLVISRRTVNWYLTIIYSKIGVSCRSAATRYALEKQLV